MPNYLVEQTQTTTTTYRVEAATEAEALERVFDRGVPIHSEAATSKPWIAGTE